MPERSGRSPTRPSSPRVRPARRSRPSRTQWHPPAVTLIDGALPEDHLLQTEVNLRSLFQRIDILIIRKHKAHPESITLLPALLTRLADVTLIELKGGTDAVDDQDPAIVLGYACQYHAGQVLERKKKAQQGPPPSMKLAFLAPAVTASFMEGLKRRGGTLERVAIGVWEGMLAGWSLLFIETTRVWKGDRRDQLFYVLTREHLEDPLAIEPVAEEERIVYNNVMDWFSRPGMDKDGGPLMRAEKLKELQARDHERMMAFIQTLTPEERLQGLRPDERLAGLNVEELEQLERLAEQLKKQKR